MENSALILASIGFFVVLLIAIIYMRYKLGNKFEIKNPDIILALLPIVIWLLLSGKITTLQLGDLKFETAFIKAKNETVVQQVFKLPVTAIQEAAKSDLDHLDAIIQAKPEALKFVVGNQTYADEVVEQYLKRLGTSTIKYIIFENANGEFIGLIPLSDLNNQIFGSNVMNQFTVHDLVGWLTQGDIDNINSIKGILTISTAITQMTTKQETLQRMEVNNSDILPVVDDNKRLQGVVERSRLTASLLLDVSKSLDR